jgi:hypothetical protein
MRAKKQQEKRIIEERLISEQRVLPKARGGGSLKYEVYGYKDAQGKDVITQIQHCMDKRRYLYR